MHIGICTIHLQLVDSRSLKDKRRIIKSLKDKVRHKFNVSIAEIDGLDKWQWATLGVACVSNDSRFTNSVLSKVVDLINGIYSVELLDYEIEVQ
jgi:hypothetical protein